MPSGGLICYRSHLFLEPETKPFSFIQLDKESMYDSTCILQRISTYWAMFTTQWDSCLVLSHPVCKRPCTARYASPNESLPQGGHRVANPHRKHGAKRAGPLVIRSLNLVKPNWGWLETIILFMEEIRLTTCYLWNSYEKWEYSPYQLVQDFFHQQYRTIVEDDFSAYPFLEEHCHIHLCTKNHC